jgi:hypothetical protein
MEEMSLVIAIDVPQQVEIKSTGVPMHETTVEFSVQGEGVSFNFPAKMVNDDVFVFTLNDSVEEYLDKTLDYKLYVYYGNARFEADDGSFNLISKKSFTAKLKNGVTESAAVSMGKTLAERLHEKTSKRPTTESEKPKETPKETPVKEETPRETEVIATKPKPTPEPTPTVTLKEAKEAIKKSTVKEGISDQDYNNKIREILNSISKTATPTSAMQQESTVEKVPETTPETTAEKAKFFDEVSKLREINEKRRKNKQVKDIIQSSKKDK